MEGDKKKNLAIIAILAIIILAGIGVFILREYKVNEDKKTAANTKTEIDEKEKDVIEALKVLGYNIKEIDNVIKTLDIKSSTEDMIKQALKILR